MSFYLTNSESRGLGSFMLEPHENINMTGYITSMPICDSNYESIRLLTSNAFKNFHAQDGFIINSDNIIYHDRSQTLNLDSASQNSKFEIDRGITSLSEHCFVEKDKKANYHKNDEMPAFDQNKKTLIKKMERLRIEILCLFYNNNLANERNMDDLKYILDVKHLEEDALYMFLDRFGVGSHIEDKIRMFLLIQTEVYETDDMEIF